MDEELRTVAALSDTIIPRDDTIGAADIAAEAFVVHYLELASPGSVATLVAALDGLAAAHSVQDVTPGLFASLDEDDRASVFEALSTHATAELRELAALAWTLVIAAFYGEWSGLDEKGRLAHQPVGWELSGFGGVG